MSPNASHRVRPGLSSAASLITTLLISFDQEVLNQHLNLVTPEYPFFESPCGEPVPKCIGALHQAGVGALEITPFGQSTRKHSTSLLTDVVAATTLSASLDQFIGTSRKLR